MRFSGLLHAELIGALASLGHTDMIVIADAGLPIPAGVPKIDLAIRANLPSFLEVSNLIAAEMPVEAITIANEMASMNSELLSQLNDDILNWSKSQSKEIKVSSLSHEDFKVLSQKARLIIRTGEFSPYANMVMHAGVAF
ncbi:D-ribose pyranase [Bartonella sp. HY329]|uniref:D-ribose pyranase n=1 Tax=unclassified Bartonella TaxID=2645622 RepID=UPI0021C7BF46|nr:MULTISPECIES: D-ribose pyranase [unclassified Bartonella]UXM94828.1 D-ribose pyranase [Bartonella sp. HY329]UXN09151.1 D-ribose pyranase [Bartonella sp. HY328]